MTLPFTTTIKMYKELYLHRFDRDVRILEKTKPHHYLIDCPKCTDGNNYHGYYGDISECNDVSECLHCDGNGIVEYSCKELEYIECECCGDEAEAEYYRTKALENKE